MSLYLLITAHKRFIYVHMKSNCTTVEPRAGCGVVRIDLSCFLTGCCKRRLNQALSFLIVWLFIRATFYVFLVYVAK